MLKFVNTVDGGGLWARGGVGMRQGMGFGMVVGGVAVVRVGEVFGGLGG